MRDYTIYDYLVYFKNFKKNSVYFDVGSSIGSTVICALSLDYKVFAFEPSSYFKNLKKIKFLVDLFSKKKLEIFNLALSNKKGKKFIYLNSKNIGNISFHKKFLSQKEGLLKENVHCVKIDQILKKINSVDIIKLDVEGHIFEILSSSKILFKLKPLLILELDKKNDKNFGKLNKILKKNNYRLLFHKNVNSHNDYCFANDKNFIEYTKKNKICKIKLLNDYEKSMVKYYIYKIFRIIYRIVTLRFYGLIWLNIKKDLTIF